MNMTWSQDLLKALHAFGVAEVVLCPGARNAALIVTLSQTTGFTQHSFFDERAAGFFAIGLARKSGRPVAVITTSGTAAAELLPAVVEAFYSGVPLILLTADRPRRLRGTGAPQSIDQTGLYAKFVSLELDLEAGEMPDLERWNRRQPLHLNLCFDEPLVDRAAQQLTLMATPEQQKFHGTSPFASSAGVEWAALRLSRFLRSPDLPVVVVGTLESDRDRDAAKNFLLRLGAPVYLEATSGLRENVELKPLTLRSGDKLLSWALKRQLLPRVLRIGGIPTVRVWRDLDELKDSASEIFSLSQLPFAGLGRGEMVCAELAPVLDQVTILERKPQAASHVELLEKDQACFEALEKLIEVYPDAEASGFRALSQLIPQGALVYIGNSLPIREWDLAATRDRFHLIEANRGVNGIDGQLSTFLGLARAASENWVVVGDLTALYDLSAPWALRSLRDRRVRIVVVNNSGGKIFARIFENSLFENRHELDFTYWAKMWGFEYRSWSRVPRDFVGSDFEVIELKPSASQSAEFWSAYDALWK